MGRSVFDGDEGVMKSEAEEDGCVDGYWNGGGGWMREGGGGGVTPAEYRADIELIAFNSLHLWRLGH